MLHEWRIDERQYARHEERRGRRHAYTSIDPRRTALVVIDMVPFFFDSNPYVAGITPNVNRLAQGLRGAGGLVAWVVPAVNDMPPARWEFFGDEIADRYQASGGTGEIGDRLCSGLDVVADDVLVEKSAASAFFPGQCDLASRLEQRDIDTVFVVGTVANVCCESTVRDASALGYRTVMVADANAASCDADLNATLHTVYRSFGDVRSTTELLELIGDTQ